MMENWLLTNLRTDIPSYRDRQLIYTETKGKTNIVIKYYLIHRLSSQFAWQLVAQLGLI